MATIFNTIVTNRVIAASNITVNMKPSSGEMTMITFAPTLNPHRTTTYDPTAKKFGAAMECRNVLNGLCDLALGKMLAYNENIFLFGDYAAEIYLDEALADENANREEAEARAKEIEENQKTENPFAPKTIGMIHSDALRYGAVEINGTIHTLHVNLAKLPNGWYVAETTRGSLRVTYAEQQAQNKYDGLTTFLTGSTVAVKVFPYFKEDGMKEFRLHNVARARIQTLMAMFEGNITRKEALAADRARLFLREEKRQEDKEARRAEKGLEPREVSTRISMRPTDNPDLDMLRKGLSGANKKLLDLIEKGAVIGVYSLADRKVVNMTLRELVSLNARWNVKRGSSVVPTNYDFSNGNNGAKLVELVQANAVLQIAARK